jgi:hypothetical protein
MGANNWLQDVSDVLVTSQDPLVRREPVSASCNQRSDEGLETQRYSLCPNEYPANCSLQWRESNGLECISMTTSWI